MTGNTGLQGVLSVVQQGQCETIADSVQLIRFDLGATDVKALSEVERGYMLHNRVLRPAMVVVGKGTDGSGK